MNDKIFLPGEEIVESDNYIQGHGTYQRNNYLCSSVYGRVNTINKLLTVHSIYSIRYSPEIGDVVVGYVYEIGNKRWRIEMNCKFEASLHLSAINIPGVVQRRKLESEEMKMREYFNLNDILVAEVQKVGKNGGAALHTRNEKYRKLTDGILVKVPAMIVKRYKAHFVQNRGVEVILGVNGYIWIGVIDIENADYKKVSSIRNYVEECRKNMVPISDEHIIFMG